MKKVFAYVAAALATVATCVLLFSVIGAAVFFIPLLGGAFAKG